MSRILVLGAGKSAPVLVRYLLDHAQSSGYELDVADLSKQQAERLIGVHPLAKAHSIHFEQKESWIPLVQTARVVISMLPAVMHPLVAEACLIYGKHLITPSYISEAMAGMDRQAKEKGLCFLNEMGLDPGIDHMSAMELLTGLKRNGAVVHSFQSYCGGLVAEAFDNNPLHYKFSWNPRNVILAGQGDGAIRFRQAGITRLMPYSRLFRNPVLLKLGERTFEGYPNRDSVKYMPIYELDDCEEFIRGTLRKPGFCAIWQAFVDLGLTDDKSLLTYREGTGWNEWLQSFLSGQDGRLSPEDYIAGLYGEEVKSAFAWLGLFSDKAIPMLAGTPAAYLQALLEPKLALQENDTDAVVMVHQIGYRLNGKNFKLSSSLYLEGEDAVNTAMARTVGLPLGIAALMLIKGQLLRTGVCMPGTEDIYIPVLKELDTFGIRFTEETTEIIT